MDRKSLGLFVAEPSDSQASMKIPHRHSQAIEVALRAGREAVDVVGQAVGAVGPCCNPPTNR